VGIRITVKRVAQTNPKATPIRFRIILTAKDDVEEDFPPSIDLTIDFIASFTVVI